MSGAELRCQAVAYQFNLHPLLSEVDLRVPSGSLTAILGRSGSGKTTLLRIISGFIRPDAGVIMVGDQVLVDEQGALPPERRSVGYVPQEGAVFPHLSVAENIGFGLPRAERKQSRRIDEVMRLVGLDESFARRSPHQLSGGELRRVALARALAPKPKVVLLDEPFTALDAVLRQEVRTAMAAALAAEGTTAVMVTHDRSEALFMGDQVGVLRDGRLVQTATPLEVYQTPADVEVARLVGDVVLLPGQASGERASCALGTVELRVARQGNVDLMIRPEQIQISTQGVDARVTASTYHGPHTLIQLKVAGAEPAEVSVSLAGQTIPTAGDQVKLEVSGKVTAYAKTRQSDAI